MALAPHIETINALAAALQGLSSVPLPVADEMTVGEAALAAGRTEDCIRNMVSALRHRPFRPAWVLGGQPRGTEGSFSHPP